MQYFFSFCNFVQVEERKLIVFFFMPMKSKFIFCVSEEQIHVVHNNDVIKRFHFILSTCILLSDHSSNFWTLVCTWMNGYEKYFVKVTLKSNYILLICPSSWFIKCFSNFQNNWQWIQVIVAISWLWWFFLLCKDVSEICEYELGTETVANKKVLLFNFVSKYEFYD